MMDGMVKWFDEKKGFGFIDSEGKDYFVHFKEIQGTGFKTLLSGDNVQFSPSKSPKGDIATKVIVVNT